MSGIPIPNLSLSSGPSRAESLVNVNGTSGTGAFSVRGNAAPAGSWSQYVVPALIVGAALWLTRRK